MKTLLPALRSVALGSFFALAGACSSSPTTTAPGVGGQASGVSGVTVSLGSCEKSASPLPGWVNCVGTISMYVSAINQSGYVSVFMNFPDSGAFYRGDFPVKAGAAPGTITINVVDEYVSGCPTEPFATTVDVRDGPQGAMTSPSIASVPVSLTGCRG